MRHKKIASVVVGLAMILGLTTAALSAQGGENPIVAALNAVQSTLSELVTAVNNLDTAEGNVLFTPTLFVFETNPSEGLGCVATNVTDAVRSIQVQIINNSGTVLNQVGANVPPNGRISPLIAFPPNGTGALAAFCKITVVDGVKSDVRGSMATFPSSGGQRDPVLAQ
jgi:hypothetical protein